MKMVLALTFFALSTLAGLSGTVPVVAQQEPDKITSAEVEQCPDERTRIDDMTHVLDLYDTVYLREDWRMSVRDEQDRGHMIFEWTPVNGASSIAAVDLQMWPCGYDDEALTDFYSPETVETLISEWDEGHLTVGCLLEGVRIFEFEVILDEKDYLARFWVAPTTDDTRVMQSYMAVPADEADLLDNYANVLYPDAPKCSK